MEENTAELIDYLRVIWKRKILILVVILVCTGIGVGVAVKNSMSPSVTTYSSTVFVKIGKKVTLGLSGGTTAISSSAAYIDNPRDMMITLPLMYSSEVKGASGYDLDVEILGAMAMLKLTLRGPDKGVERSLKELVDMLIEKHHRMAENSVDAYKNLMKKLEVDAKVLKKDIFVIDKSIEEMKRKEGEYLISIESNATVKEGDKTGGDRSAFMNMLYLKSVDKERDLSNARKELRIVQRQLMIHQMTLDNLEEYKTEVVTAIGSPAILVSIRDNKEDYSIAIAGVAGLIMSLFIAFFVEYLGNQIKRGKENSKVDSA